MQYSHTTRQLLAATTLLFSTLLFTPDALGAGFFLPTRGVESTGRGSASIAPHRADLNALWFNPAGLTLLGDLELTIDLALVGLNVAHQRAPRTLPDSSVRTYEPVNNQAGPMTIPQILIGGPTPHPKIFWAAGAYTPYTGSARYPADGPQRYVLVDNVGSALGYIHGAVGWQVTDRLSIGAGIQNFIGSFRIVTVASGYVGIFGDPEDEDLDLLAVTTISSFFGPTANLGATYDLTPNLRLGLSAQLPHIFRDKNATIDTEIPEHAAYDNAQISDNKADITIPFPFFIRGGLRYFTDRYDLEIALVYQHWSMLDVVHVRPHSADITGVPGIGSIPVANFVVPQRFRNTFSAHLGGEFSLTDTFALRGGYVFERGAVPDSQYSVFALDPDKHQLSLGLSQRFQSLTLHLTGSAILMPSKQITTSEVRQINPSDDNGELGIIVANGTYDHFGYMAGIGLNYRF